jgi:hydroxymethylpyrimidine pyrophosphatase-like HAD family hydrolase
MRYLALASDYDGTLAEHGSVSDETIEALRIFRQSRRKLILVTGRELADLLTVFPQAELCECIVAENGAVLYWPATRDKRVLGATPPPQFVELLRNRGVEPLGVGDVIVGTWHPNENIVLDAIRELGLELQVIFNKGAVMVLPSGINKQSGLAAALAAMDISPHNVAGVGDAENDHALLNYCECAVAVANALPAVKAAVDIVTEGDHGAGVRQLIDRILKDDLASWEPKLERRSILLGQEVEEQVLIRPYGAVILIAGLSGGGKSTFVTALLEQLAEKSYQACLIDPEGDYDGLHGVVVFGDDKHAPEQDQIAQALQKPDTEVAVNLMGMPLERRPDYFSALFARLERMRVQTGRPHWIVIDEAHHMLPPEWVPSSAAVANELNDLILITVHPDHVAPPVLRRVNVVIAIGRSPENAIQEFARIAGVTVPERIDAVDDQSALVWMRDSQEIRHVQLISPTVKRQRHKRNYAVGELGADQSFYFRGAEGKLNLRAQNLMLFIQIAEGIDDQTWQFHLRNGDYSKWFRKAIKDSELADEVQEIEKDATLDPRVSKARVSSAIRERYTAPA